MASTRRQILGSMLAAGGAAAAQSGVPVTRYIRYRHNNTVSYGVADGEVVRPVSGNIFGRHKVGDQKLKLASVKLLAPCEPPKVLAVGLNYRSHIGNRPAPKRPEIFYKPTTCLQDPDGPIVIPKDAANVHYEGELVVVIGKTVRHATAEQAREAIFGVTCGNDVSERDWQNGADKDLQWWRAKGADTFGPLGPAIVRGLDYGKLLLQTRLNGKVVQKQFTSDLLFDCPAIVSWVSHYVTLGPGDLIYTGTPGTTQKMSPGDVVEIDIEGIGVLKNTVAAAS